MCCKASTLNMNGRWCLHLYILLYLVLYDLACIPPLQKHGTPHLHKLLSILRQSGWRDLHLRATSQGLNAGRTIQQSVGTSRRKQSTAKRGSGWNYPKKTHSLLNSRMFLEFESILKWCQLQMPWDLSKCHWPPPLVVSGWQLSPPAWRGYLSVRCSSSDCMSHWLIIWIPSGHSDYIII